MRLLSLRVKNFRNHRDITCEFSPHVTLIHGMNGTGKTSLLEAIYMLYRGRSFKGSDTDALRTGAHWYRADVYDDSPSASRSLVLDMRGETKKKSFTVDGKPSARLAPKYKKPIILFTPDTMRLIDGSPARRREYLDTVISQYDERYQAALRRYERALMQRNKLLKQPNVTEDMLFPWNVALSDSGAYIIAARVHLLSIINTKLAGFYEKISSQSVQLSAQYSHQDTSPQGLLAQYEAGFQKDIYLGNTSIGPHRHDMLLALNKKSAQDVVSRGEARTIVLALKYIEAELVSEKFNDHPLILLDDVFGELDASRQRHLLKNFSDSQIIITSTTKHKADHSIGL